VGRLYRYHPRKRGPVVPQGDQAPYLSYWVHPVNQPLRRKPKVIEIGGGVSSNATNAPYLSNWVHATNQPLRNRTPRRQQPIVKPAPFYGIPTGSNDASNDVGFWIQDVNQPQRNRIPKRQQPQSPQWNVAPMRPFQTNFDFERLPPSTATPTTSAVRWIDGTAAGNTGTPYGWALVTAGAPAGFDTTTFHSGTASMKLSTTTVGQTCVVCTFRNNPPSPGWLPTETFPIQPNTRYVISVWAMSNNALANNVFLDFRQYSATGSNLVTTSTTKIGGTTGWTLLTVALITDASAAWGAIILRINTAGNISDAWFDDITVTQLPLPIPRLLDQPLRKRVPKRLQLPATAVPPAIGSQAPYVSYWKQPVNQPQRNNIRKRQQPTASLEPFYGIPVVSGTPSVASWVHPTNQPLRNRVKGQRQLPASEVPPTIGSQAPYVSYWKQPTNQPLKSRVPKRQQPRANAPPVAPQTSAAPYLSYWVQPVNQPLRARIPKRQQLPRIKPLSGFAPTLETWKKAVNQPYKVQLRKRQQPAPRRNLYAATASAPIAPVVSSWVHPVNQRLRTKPQYRQAALRLQPLLNLASAPATTPIWVPETTPTGSTWLPDDSAAVIWVPENDPASTWNPE
jgi:hypothetical protein